MNVEIFYKKLSAPHNTALDLNNVMINILELYEVGKKVIKKYLLDIGQKSPGSHSLASSVP